jgi:hypothetical protein
MIPSECESFETFKNRSLFVLGKWGILKADALGDHDGSIIPAALMQCHIFDRTLSETTASVPAGTLLETANHPPVPEF